MVDFLKKRLQVFVSSTYSDLKDERQAAVEAILVAGHIPAGMELFTAGDESQMEVIRQWIDESDVYLLLLGGRYGSIEPKSGKSYTHLEYDYAMSRNKPSFALVVTNEGLDHLVGLKGRGAIEAHHPKGLDELRSEVLNKLVRFWTDTKDIRIAVGETLSTFARREDLLGWVRPEDQSNLPALATEIARLSKENSALREQLSHTNVQAAPLGIGYPNLLKILESRALLKPLLTNAKELISHYGLNADEPELTALLELGLIQRRAETQYRVIFADHGIAFLNWLRLRDLQEGTTTTTQLDA